MSLKEEFMQIKTYEDYDKRRDDFRKLDFDDEEVFEHWKELHPSVGFTGCENGIITELYKKDGTIG